MTLCYSHRKEDPFARIDKAIVYDNNISWKAKGILLYAFSQSSNDKLCKTEMMKHSSDGETSFDSGIKELEKKGYLYRVRAKNDAGRFTGWEYYFFAKPISEEEFKKKFSVCRAKSEDIAKEAPQNP